MLLEFVLTILYTYISVWNHKETSKLATALAEWLVPLWYYTELRSKLCDVNFVIGKALYCDFGSLKTSSAKVDEISLGR